MYTRKQIIENQKKFRKEIIDYLKLEFKQTKKELSEIKSEDKTIKEEKEKLENKFNKIKISNEIENHFISEKNQDQLSLMCDGRLLMQRASICAI
jgi:hypothetical protein